MAMGLRLLMKLLRVGLGLGLGVKVVFFTGARIEGEKHCFMLRVGEGEPHTRLGEVKMCSDSEKDRGRR